MKYRFPSQYSKDPQEKLYAERMSSYLNKNNSTYSSEFERQVRSLGWMPVAERVKKAKVKILKFCYKYQRLPSVNGHTKTERDLGNKLNGYYNNSRGDTEFTKKNRCL